MSSQLGAISSVNSLIGRVFKQPRGDFADRLNSLYTVCVLAVSSGLLLTSHFWGSAITCWTPAEFNGIWSDFVNKYCYVHGTYFYSIDEELDFDVEKRQKIFIRYYQWVPYILALQAFLFYIPRLLMRMMCTWSGYDLSATIQYIDDIWHQIKSANFSSRVESFEKIGAVYIIDGLKLFSRKNRGSIGMYYVVYTVMQACNAWLQFFFLNALISSSNEGQSGYQVITDLISGADWQETGHFPRITHCDFQRRKPSSIQMDTVLCVLTLNIYYEKVLIFLYFWLFFVAMVSTIHCFYWTILCFCTQSYIKRQMKSFLTVHSKSSFVQKFFKILGHDGIFVLHQISLNIGDLPGSYLALAILNVLENEDDREELQTLIEKAPKAV